MKSRLDMANSFAAAIHGEVIEANSTTYESLLCTPIAEVQDDRWRAFVDAYGTMTAAQQTAVRALLRQVAVDTASNILGIIDGSSILDQFRGSFALTYTDGTTNEVLSGDLQDLFLSLDEE